MKSPSVSGALLYAELCMAAKNEEKRTFELKKRMQFKHRPASQSSTEQKRSFTPKQVKGNAQKTMQRVNPATAKCHKCGRVGHFQRDCKQQKTES